MNIPEELLERISEFIAVRTGLSFPKRRWNDLERGFLSAAREFGFKDAGACLNWLLSSEMTRERTETLAGHLTVGETYFFREKKSFEILEEKVLPELIEARRPGKKFLRIWSAGCATGEEPYSIAILLRKMVPDIADWNISILASDINPAFLRGTSRGVYNEWSFRDAPRWLTERYFSKTDEKQFEILTSVRNMVTFFYHNLAQDAYPSLMNGTNAMDIILCRNVLMYFTEDQIRKVIGNFHRSLVEGGWLIVSVCEVSNVLFSQFSTVNIHGMTLYRKQETVRQAAVEFPDDSCAAPEFPEIRPVMAYEEARVYSSMDTVQAQIPESPVPAETPVPDPRKVAAALYSEGHYAEAAEKIEMLASDAPLSPEDMEVLARANANMGRLDQARKWCERAVGADKMNPGRHYLLATILLEQGREDDSACSLKRALYLDHNFVLAHFALGNLALRQGRLKESKRHFRNALSILKGSSGKEDVVPESEGMTAERLMEIIRAMPGKEAFA